MFKLQTERLVLRDLAIVDWAVLHRLRTDPQVTQYMDYLKSSTPAETWTWVYETMDHNSRTPRLSYNLVIVRKTDQHLLGWIGIGQASRPAFGDLDFGYALLPEYWRQGYAAEALGALLDYAFTHLGARKIYGECHPQNRASVRVMEKVGLHQEPGMEPHPSGKNWLRYAVARNARRRA